MDYETNEGSGSTYSLGNAHAPKQHVHLLERQALRLRDAQPDENRAAEGQYSKEDERPVAGMAGQYVLVKGGGRVYVIFVNMTGVICPTMKLLIQLLLAPSAMP